MSRELTREALNPLISPRGRELIRAMQQHPDAPRFNHTAGDRLVAADLEALAALRSALARAAPARLADRPSEAILARVERWLRTVPLFRERCGKAFDPARDFAEFPTMSRKDLAERPAYLVPDDATMERMIVYRTSGATGHALLVPHHPLAAAAYPVLTEAALARRGLASQFDEGRVACFLVGAQLRTVTYPTVLAAWGGAGFAKLNLNEEDWPKAGSAPRYFEAFAPEILTGDPLSFARLLTWEEPAKLAPRALISTAVGMSAALKEKLEAHVGAPVIDWYSLTETGPIGYMAEDGSGYRVLPHDLYVEALRPDGRRAAPGEIGEITVTGGRNPFVPLLRYRTGDFGRLVERPSDGGGVELRIEALEGREPTVLRARTGAIVNPIDLSRVLRDHPILQQEIVQRADASVDVAVRPLPTVAAFDVARLREELESLFEDGTPVRVRVDATLGDGPSGKVRAFRTELRFDE